MDARKSAVCRCNVGFSKISPDKHVDVCVDSDEDRGSNPLASNLRLQRSRERRPSRRSFSEGGLLLRCHEHEASNDLPVPKTFGLSGRSLGEGGPFSKIRSSQFVCNFLARVKNKASHGEARGAITVINPIGTLDLASMNYRLLGKLFYHSAILLACVTLSCRPQQAVILSPEDTDLVVLNGCVISACNYLAVVKTQHALDTNFWAKILLVRYNDHPAGHAYCVWETDGTIYGYDRNAGSFPIPVYTRDARAIAIVLAQELGKVMNEPLSVDRAEFVESQHARVYKF